MLLETNIIKSAALSLGRSCTEIFISLVLSSNPQAVSEKNALKIFADQSCSTKYTDAMWIIAKTESDFRFAIASENREGKTFRVLYGMNAINYARSLDFLAAHRKKTDEKYEFPNVDLGVLQVNARSHHGEEPFKKNKALLMSPAVQVDYVTNHFIPMLKSLCGKNWPVCYHSPGNEGLQKKYRKKLRIGANALKATAFRLEQKGILKKPIVSNDPPKAMGNFLSPEIIETRN